VSFLIVKPFFAGKRNIFIAIMGVIILLLVSTLYVGSVSPPDISKNVFEQQDPVDSDVAGIQTIPLSTFAPTEESTDAPDTRQKATVVKVVDGDTIAVSINGKSETIRIIGIDTPEIVDPRKTVECFGKEASDFANLTLQDNKIVLLESDPTQGDKDKYQRLLRYVWIDDVTDFGKLMINDGFASEYTYNLPYKYQNEYKQAEKNAREANKGLWADDACVGYSEMDCSDFSVQDEAQTYFEGKGGSPTNNVDRLDSDHDGLACESLP
jgi:micrococcal nuclease